MGEGNKIARNTIFLSIRMLFVLIISLYTTRVVLNVVGVEDYGIYNVVCGFVALFAFLNTAMANSIQRYYNAEIGKAGDINKVYNAAFTIQLLLLIIIVIVTEFVGEWYLNNKINIPLERLSSAKIIFHLSILSYVFIIMQVPYSALILAKEKMEYFAIVSVVEALLKLFMAFIIPYVSYDKLISYGCFNTLVSFVGFIMFYIYVKKHYKQITLLYKIDNAIFKSMLKFSSWNVFGTFANAMKEQGVNLIFNFYFGPIVNAARAISIQVLSAFQGFVGNINLAVRPQIVQFYSRGEYDKSIDLMYNQSKLSLGVLWLLSYPILLEINYILKVWLGDAVPQYTSSFIIIVVVTSFVNNLNTAVSAIIHASGKMMKYQLVTSFITLSSLPIIFIMSRHNISPELILLVGLLFAITMQTASLFILKDVINFKISSYLKKVLYPFALSFMCSALWPLIPHILLSEGMLRLILVVCVSVLSYLFCFYKLSLTNEQQIATKQYLNRLLKYNKR